MPVRHFDYKGFRDFLVFVERIGLGVVERVGISASLGVNNKCAVAGGYGCCAVGPVGVHRGAGSGGHAEGQRGFAARIVVIVHIRGGNVALSRNRAVEKIIGVGGVMAALHALFNHVNSDNGAANDGIVIGAVNNHCYCLGVVGSMDICGGNGEAFRVRLPLAKFLHGGLTVIQLVSIGAVRLQGQSSVVRCDGNGAASMAVYIH